jgi:DNA primase
MDKNELRQKYTATDILHHYGISINRHGFINCISHADKNASMKVYEKNVNCFSCGKNLDIFELYRILSNHNSEPFNELIQRFCEDFGETYQTKPNHVKPNRSALDEQRKIKRARYFCRMEQLRIARYRKEIYRRPMNLGKDVHDKWVVACQQERVITDYMQSEGFEVKREIQEEWCKQYE